jgi:Xaa-Pro dipeptidase
MFDLDAIQAAVRDSGFDAWLLYDFRGANELARRVLGMQAMKATSRRFFYLIPAQGPPRKLVHRIESGVLDHLPGEPSVYLTWQELEAGLRSFVGRMRRVAMEYAPLASNPYVARVDAGTIELIHGFGPQVVSSGDLIQRFESTWDDDQWQSHLEAEVFTRAAFDLAFGLIADRTRDRGSVRETEVQAAIMDHFGRNGLITYSPPIVAVGPHSGDPHYEPVAGKDAEIHQGDFVLIDLWAKMDRPRSVYSDLTRVGYVGTSVPDDYERVFKVVAAGRDAAIALVKSAFAACRPLRGYQVDRAARDVIDAASYGEFFVHRTGHNIGQEVHGNGAAMDDLETHEQRLVLPRTCFSIEPGIYQDRFGVRSEINVFIDGEGRLHVTGGLQRRVLPILGDWAGVID